MKSVTWKGKTYGVPTNNETMALIWNAGIFDEAGLDPESPPATWTDLVEYSKQIKEKTGKNGYGLVARVNAGNTPFRFMPHAWAYGGGALDEAEDSPSYEEIYINNEGTRAALQDSYDMYVRDQSVPGLGAHQHQRREPRSVHVQPARDDDPSSERLCRDPRSRRTRDRRGQEGRGRGRREHALRPDP
jgi:ABC-type glycerol-3-phosphate transport system substrate-binding protein